ncbi:ABC transporter, ATP-binding protein [Clostridiales bacterium oral taxon 876 str. F0540]|nr:ABC transporter, ATP-binding protein [Clostridiales bacterium oral taxon 876 str. F0540]
MEDKKERKFMFELSLNGIKKYMEATLVLKNITFQVYSGEKVGIVGVNGSGKTTILKLIAGVLPMNYWPGYPQTSSPGYDEGLIMKPKEATCAYLEQIPEYPEGLKVIEVLNLAFEEVHSIEVEMRKLEEKMRISEGDELNKALDQYSRLTQLYEVKGGYDMQEKLSRVCKGLKFEDSFLNKDFSLLSGGEKTTVVLGKLLIDNPDILLLDEPTNHLDMDSIEWLEGYLKNYKGIVIIVSHDRYFLDNVVNKIIEIEDMECITYKGNYSSYVAQKEENLRIQFENYREQQKKINAMEKTIKDLRDWAMRADNNKFFRRAASMQIKLEKMEKIDRPALEKRNMKLNLKAAQRSGNETVKAEGLYKSFEDKVIFKNAGLLVNYGERVALIGPNGSGKTTFLKMLLGEEIPDSGKVELGASVMAAYLPQRITFKNEELTVLDCFREDIYILEGKAREYLSKFMFYGSTVFKKVKFLSGGEKIRLKLAKLLYEDINLLILDEPTNHLDIDSIETIEEALEDFKGTIFFISHDRYFINKIGERVIAIEDNAFKSYLGSYDYYKSIKDEQKQQLIKEPVIKVEKPKKPKTVDENKKREVEKAKVEARVENLEDEIKELDLAMSVIGLDYEELNKLFCRKEELSKELEGAMEMWLSFNS